MLSPLLAALALGTAHPMLRCGSGPWGHTALTSISSSATPSCMTLRVLSSFYLFLPATDILLMC